MFLLNNFILIITFLITTTNAYNDTQCGNQNITINNNYKSNNHLRLTQYNVEWLFTNEYNGCPGTSCTWVNESEAYTHLEYVKKNFDDISPDIMNLCEVEGCDELNMLSSNSTSHIPYLIFGKDTYTGQNVGLLTKFKSVSNIMRTDEYVTYPIPESTCDYKGEVGSEGVSKNYYIRFSFNSIFIHIIGVHFLAYPTDVTRCAQREAQAQIIQNLIINIMTNYPEDELIVIGDMNDFDGDVLDVNSNKPLSSVLEILKGTKGIYKDKYSLTNIASFVEQSKRYSDWWDQDENCISSMNEFSMIDHILVTPFLFNKINKVEFYHKYKEYCGKYNSDHFPIIVDFIF